MVVHTFNPSTRDAGRSLEFEASLAYRVNSRTAKGYTEKPYLGGCGSWGESVHTEEKTLGLILRRETPQRERYVNVLPKSIWKMTTKA